MWRRGRHQRWFWGSMNRSRMMILLISQKLGEGAGLVWDEGLSIRYVEFEVMVAPCRDVWKATSWTRAWKSRKSCRFGSHPHKVKFKALGKDEISISEGMERKQLITKCPWGEGRSYRGLRRNVQGRERRQGQWVITEVSIVEGFQEEVGGV